jgi:hypothetical protein
MLKTTMSYICTHHHSIIFVRHDHRLFLDGFIIAAVLSIPKIHLIPEVVAVPSPELLAEDQRL